MDVPDRMRVARLYAWGDVRIEEEPVPAPGAGEALIRVTACGVCGTDALRWYVERKAPVVLGHEAVGVVVATGADVRQPAVGDRVFVHHHAPCLDCAECRRGTWSNCATWRRTHLEPGGFAGYVRVSATALAADTLPLPDSLDDDAATFIEPLACCLRAVRRQGALAEGDAVLIIGLGAMGQLMVSIARAFGAGFIAGSDFLEDRRARALSRGMVLTLDPAAEDVPAAVRAATGGRGADVVIVCPGDAPAVQTGLEAAAPGGRVVCFTPIPPDRTLEVDASALYFREVTLAHSYSCGPDETREALRLLADGTIEAASLVTHRAGLDGVAAALERAHGKGMGLKTVIHPHAVARAGAERADGAGVVGGADGADGARGP